VVQRKDSGPKMTAPLEPLQDAQRALSLVRSKAQEWGLDPRRIGMMGFSAGAHLTAAAETNFDRRSYEPIDDIDRVSCRPDFAVVLYAGLLVDNEDKSRLRPTIRVSKDSPPTFFAMAANDQMAVENSLTMFQALWKAGVPVEMHIYTTGGHGFGLRPSADPCSTWPQRCAEWLRNQGLLQSK
jgi:acetyl esterase/lipase